MIRSALLMLRMETFGSSRSEYGLVTCSPSNEATVTRKRGSGASPFKAFHSKPALWNTSIGPMAVEA